MRRLERKAIKAEIGKTRENLGLRLPSEVAPAIVGVLGRGRRPGQRHARAFERVALLALVEHQGYARVGEKISGVHGETREQQQRRTVGRARHVDERTKRIAGTAHQRRERAGPRLAHELLRCGLGIEIGGLLQ